LAQERIDLARLLADCHGRKGGIYRRKGELEKALESYRLGWDQEQKYEIVDSYNLTNALMLSVLLDPAALTAKQEEIKRAADTVERQVRSTRGDQWWAWADLGLLSLLRRDTASWQKAQAAYEQYALAGARAPDFASTIGVLQQCHDQLAATAPDVAHAMNKAIAFLNQKKPA
jgi:tetratricopeptide (TPR) repeat protein